MTLRIFLTAAAASTAFVLGGASLGHTKGGDRDCPPGHDKPTYCEYGERDKDGDRGCPRRTITGTAGNDQLVGTKRGETIRGLAGNDEIDGARGNDCLFGNAGDDKITGGPGRDQIRAGRGDDSVFADDGKRDRVRCGPGKDSAVIDDEDVASKDCESVDER